MAGKSGRTTRYAPDTQSAIAPERYVSLKKFLLIRQLEVKSFRLEYVWSQERERERAFHILSNSRFLMDKSIFLFPSSYMKRQRAWQRIGREHPTDLLVLVKQFDSCKCWYLVFINTKYNYIWYFGADIGTPICCGGSSVCVHFFEKIFKW